MTAVCGVVAPQPASDPVSTPGSTEKQVTASDSCLPEDPTLVYLPEVSERLYKLVEKVACCSSPQTKRKAFHEAMDFILGMER